MRFIQWLVISLLLVTAAAGVSAQDRVKPFVLAQQTTGAFDDVLAATRARLDAAGFDVLGEYRPYDGATVFAVTHEALQSAAQAVETGTWGAVLRVSVTDVEDAVQVSFSNPVYLAIAYRLEDDLVAVRQQLVDALGYLEDFGAEKGLRPKSLRKYRYMFGMERVDDLYELGVFESQREAINAVEQGLKNNKLPASKVYRLDLDANTTLYGIGMRGNGDDGKYHDDAYQMSVVDFHDLKGTAYLPYELRVQNGEVSALHMRYRMALHYPDLSMMGKHSFMTLRPSPDAIESLLQSVVAGASE